MARLNLVDAAVLTIEHDAFMIVFLDEREPLTIGAQASILRDKVLQADAEMLGDGLQFVLFKPHITRPFATGRAALADVVHRRIQI